MFRIPSGAGGIAQAYASAELAEHLRDWRNETGKYVTVEKSGYDWYCSFDTERDAVLFLTTFKPKRDHWWQNARIE